jgi:hypothetical protein
VVVGEAVATLTTRHSRTTWLHHSTRSISSAEGQSRLAFVASGLRAVMLLQLCLGAFIAKATFASLHFIQRRYFAVWLPRSYSTETVPERQGIHRRCGRLHTRLIRVRIRSYAACVLSSGSVYNAMFRLVALKSPPSLADRRAR